MPPVLALARCRKVQSSRHSPLINGQNIFLTSFRWEEFKKSPLTRSKPRVYRQAGRGWDCGQPEKTQRRVLQKRIEKMELLSCTQPHFFYCVSDQSAGGNCYFIIATIRAMTATIRAKKSIHFDKRYLTRCSRKYAL